MKTCNHRLAVSGGLAALGLLMTLPPVAAQTVEEQLAELRARVDDMEYDPDKGFRIGPNTRLKFYGYVKADLIQDLDFDLGTTFFGLDSIVPGAPTDDNFRAQAWQTRLGVDTYTDTAFGELHTKIEGDFFGNGGGSFRLRHAYGELNGWLIGQTWTNFMPIESYPDSLDFQGPAGIPFTRQTQVRYTHDFGNGFGLSGSIENDPVGGVDRPAVTAAATYAFGDSFVKLAALSRTANGATQEVDGWGINLSGNTSLWQGGSLQASYTTGEAIGSYMVFGGADTFGDTAIETSGVTVGLLQAVTPKIDAGLVYGLRDIDLGAATDTETLQTVHASVYFKPVDKVRLGLEYITGERELFNGTSESADRIQFSAQYNF